MELGSGLTVGHEGSSGTPAVDSVSGVVGRESESEGLVHHTVRRHGAGAARHRCSEGGHRGMLSVELEAG